MVVPFRQYDRYQPLYPGNYSTIGREITDHRPTWAIPNGARNSMGARVSTLRVKPTDLLWSPANSGPIRIANQVLTLHDIIPLDHPRMDQTLDC